jgi:hypothetical protein
MANAMNRRRSPKTDVDDNLVRRLQLAVSGVSSADTMVDEKEPAARIAPSDEVEDEGIVDPRTTRELTVAGRREALVGRARRTTLSVPHAVGKKARQLTMAITAAEQQDASLGQTLGWALDLLEAELKDKGVPIAAHAVRLRSGPRGG